MKFPACSFLAALLALHLPGAANAQTGKVLLDVRSPDAAQHLVPSSPQVSVSRSTDPAVPGLEISALLGGKENYPGVSFKPTGGPVFDLSAYGHVEARVANTGTKVTTVCLRVDNDGPWQAHPWNTESIVVQPGMTDTVKVYFGYASGKADYPLKPAEVSNLLFFVRKSDIQQSFRIESLTAGGTPGEQPAVDPNSIRVKPKGGSLFGPGVAFDVGKQVTAAGTTFTLADAQLRVEFPAASTRVPPAVTVKPAVGRWDLRDCLEVRIKLRNSGNTSLTPSAHVESNGGASETVAGAPLAPGASAELVVPFANAKPGDPSQKKLLTHLTNDTVSGVTILSVPGGPTGSLAVESIRADVPPVPVLPDWLGKRPPAEGDWVKTYADEFDGATLDATHWNVYSSNWWDPKKTHWTKENVLIGGGFAKLRYEKKTGHQNDDPNGLETPYATGYLDTLGKWTQRYGYFEARMKLPTAPGLWPAFWMMPDRGPSAEPKRQDTYDGGMEFDIMEHLTRWGGLRYNIAEHWDGYKKDHKSNGADKVYFQPDKDGFLTCGLLWLPGQLTYYCNGKEVLRWEDPRVSNVPAFLIFYMPSGGWDNDATDDKQLPADFVIDYVRAWQRKDLASPLDHAPAGASVSKR